MLASGFKCNSSHLVLSCVPCRHILWDATISSSDAWKRDPPPTSAMGSTHVQARSTCRAPSSHFSFLSLLCLSFLLLSRLLCTPTWCCRDIQVLNPQHSEAWGKLGFSVLTPTLFSLLDLPDYHFYSMAAFLWSVENLPVASKFYALGCLSQVLLTSRQILSYSPAKIHLAGWRETWDRVIPTHVLPSFFISTSLLSWGSEVSSREGNDWSHLLLEPSTWNLSTWT